MTTRYQGVPVIGFVGFSGSGKTTILTQVIENMHLMGKSVAAIKHTHHRFDIDKKGKDSYRFRESGARQVMVSSKKRFALMVEMETQEPDLNFLISHLNLTQLDFILFEGFKHEAYPKIEVHRQELEHPFLFSDDEDIVALAIDRPTSAYPIQVLDLNNVDEIVGFLMDFAANSN